MPTLPLASHVYIGSFFLPNAGDDTKN